MIATGVTSVSGCAGRLIETPPQVLVIDEAADLFVPQSNDREDKALAAEATHLVSVLVRQGRATAISVVLATQRAATDSLPAVIRDNATVKVVFRCTTAEQAKAVLGDLAALGSGSLSPTRIPAATPGVAVTTTVTGELARIRVLGSATSPRLVIEPLEDPPMPPPRHPALASTDWTSPTSATGAGELLGGER